MLTIRHPGLLSTLQDGGRSRVQALGVTPGGAVDDLALQVGNMIVGNSKNTLAIEMTFQGIDIEFSDDTLIALTGAPLLTRDTTLPVPMWRPLWVRAGARLALGRMLQGARSYLCIQGGLIAPNVLGGCGVDLRNGFGGLKGRALTSGDRLSIATQDTRYAGVQAALKASTPAFLGPAWSVSVWRDWWLAAQRPLPLLEACQPAAQGHAIQTLMSSVFTVLPASDRQGLRLQGPPLPIVDTRKISEGVCFGLMQLPPDGQPIILLADHQTTGGYPVLGVVANIARSALAQARPGDTLRFTPMSLEQAHEALWQREQRLQYLLRILNWRM